MSRKGTMKITDLQKRHDI